MASNSEMSPLVDALSGKKGGDKKSKKKSSKKKSPRFKTTHIEHHHDGSHTVRHASHEGGDDLSYASPDLQGVHAGLDQHLGEEAGAEEASPAMQALSGAGKTMAGPSEA